MTQFKPEQRKGGEYVGQTGLTFQVFLLKPFKCFSRVLRGAYHPAELLARPGVREFFLV